jgi:hypothetical protein
MKIMKKVNMFPVLGMLMFWMCMISCQSKIHLDSYVAEVVLTVNEEKEFKNSIIRYIGKLHKKANHTNKFDSFFDSYYEDLLHKHELVYYVKNHHDGFDYFCFTRIAPSLKIKKVAIAGRVKKSDTGDIIHYEEVYRTWKMEPDELKKKNDQLFTMLLQGKDLSPYYNHLSGEEEWIEFPDKDVVYDIEARRWIKTNDPLSDMMESRGE